MPDNELTLIIDDAPAPQGAGPPQARHEERTAGLARPLPLATCSGLDFAFDNGREVALFSCGRVERGGRAVETIDREGVVLSGTGRRERLRWQPPGRVELRQQAPERLAPAQSAEDIEEAPFEVIPSRYTVKYDPHLMYPYYNTYNYSLVYEMKWWEYKASEEAILGRRWGARAFVSCLLSDAGFVGEQARVREVAPGHDHRVAAVEGGACRRPYRTGRAVCSLRACCCWCKGASLLGCWPLDARTDG